MGNANLGAQSSDAPLPGGAIANTSISSAELDSSSVTTAKLAANAVTAAKIAAGTITIAELAQSLKNYLVPIGSVIPFAGGSAPTGFLICDGSTHDISGTCATCGLAHSDLAALLSTTYGGTAGSTFKLPDLQGRLPVGKGTHADVNALNNNEGVTTVSSRTPNHTHSVPAHKHVITAIALGDDSPDHNHTNSLGYYVEGTQHNGPGFEDHSSSLIGGVDWTSGGANQRHSHGLHSSYINNVDYNRAGNSGATSGDSSFSTSAQSSAQRVPYIVLNYIIKAI